MAQVRFSIKNFGRKTKLVLCFVIPYQPKFHLQKHWLSEFYKNEYDNLLVFNNTF